MILISPSDPVLHTKAGHINMSKPDFDITATAMEMLALMERHDGIGLAAPQVGIGKRLFVLKIDGIVMICINPIIEKMGKRLVTISEGCLSYPGEHVLVSRPDEIKVSYLDLSRRRHRATLTHMWSRAFLHELDHLNGIVFHERKS